ncbi:hypothetical protein LPBF_12120 [Flavobacterium crassostreae]|uniref:Uncharacterized protein n=1 Tax=Flavobacterium crassostreae TaxID=1763534 RepID=A0A1B9DKG9_9FLAO|nr:hypothetical protein LPBF_12120 [Flavobacterium crassostreae]
MFFIFWSHSQHPLQAFWLPAFFIGTHRSFLWSLCAYHKKQPAAYKGFSLLLGLAKPQFYKKTSHPPKNF